MYHSLIQLLSAARLIGRPSGATIKELVEKLDLTSRSVYRLLNALDELGYPYYQDKAHGNRYHLIENERNLSWWMPLPAISFDLEDRVLLEYLFESAARDPALAAKIKSLREKLAFVGAAAGYALAPKESGAGPGKKPTMFLTAPTMVKVSGPDEETHLKALFEAISHRHTCELSYESRESGSVKTYPVNPLAVFESEGGLYFFGEVPYYGSIRVYALERVRALKELEQHFVVPEHFDAGARLSDPFGIIQGAPFAVRLVFSQEQAPYVRERVWPQDYRLEDLTDGRMSMEFETGGAFGLRRWILSWGADVEVMGPDWLRNEIRDEVEEMYKRMYAE